MISDIFFSMTSEVFRRKCPVDVEIVVETVFYCRAYGEFCFGKKFLYRMGHDVGCAVAVTLPFLFYGKIDQLDPTPFV